MLHAGRVAAMAKKRRRGMYGLVEGGRCIAESGKVQRGVNFAQRNFFGMVLILGGREVESEIGHGPHFLKKDGP